MDEFHDDTGSANLGYAFTSATQIRVTASNSDAATGTPGPFNFYGIANAGKRSNQDTYLGASIENRTYGNWHNLVRYGMTRKRQEDINFYPAGLQLTTSNNYYGYNTVIDGANGYSVTGQAILNFPGTYPNTVEQVNNRDQFYFQSDYPFTQHILGLFTFRYDDERGAKKSAVYGIDQNIERANYDYTGQLQGNYHSRLFYSLGGGVEKNQLFGTVGVPRLGLAYYPVRPGKGIFHGTKIWSNFAQGFQEPSLDEQFASLYDFLLNLQGGRDAIQQYHISPIEQEQSRTFEGGVAQSFLSERGLLRIGYFHNQYRRQIEPVPATEVPSLLPQLSPSQQESLKSLLEQRGSPRSELAGIPCPGHRKRSAIHRLPDIVFARRLHLSGCGGAALLYLGCAATIIQHRPALENPRPPSRRCPSEPLTPCGARGRLSGHRIPALLP